MATLRNLGFGAARVADRGRGVRGCLSTPRRVTPSLPFTADLPPRRRPPGGPRVHQPGIAAGHQARHRACPGRPEPAVADRRTARRRDGRRRRAGDMQFADLPTGAWREPPGQALLIPLRQPGQSLPFGVFVVGVNRYRPLDAGYRGFLDLVAGQLAAVIGSARAYETERLRAERLAELDRGQDDVLHQHQPRVPHAADPAARAGRGRARRPGRHRWRRNSARASSWCSATPVGCSSWSTVCSTSRGSRPAGSSASLRAGRPREVDDRARQLVRLGDRTCRPHLTIDCPELGERVKVDQEMWAKVVLNLLSNALKFTFDGGITVSPRASTTPRPS